MSNFLILTPDGVGSTYLQRALTVYLNASEHTYYNTHELLNGLALDSDFNLYKKWLGYRQSLEEISDMLDANQASLVSRLAQYHIEKRLNGEMPEPPKGVPTRLMPAELLQRNQEEDYKPFYKKCRGIFDRIIYCVRDPFEYSLSWSIRKLTGKMNVYTIQERIETHGEDVTYDIDLDFMKRKLHQYNRYLYWVKDNFPDAIVVNYDDIHNDIDLIVSNLTGLDFYIKDVWGISLQEYSVLMYKLSKMYNSNVLYSDNIMSFQKKLVEEKKMPNNTPIKMTTLHEKSRKITNFIECIDTYNKFINSSNEFPVVSKSDIYKRIENEDRIYKD